MSEYGLGTVKVPCTLTCMSPNRFKYTPDHREAGRYANFVSLLAADARSAAARNLANRDLDAADELLELRLEHTKPAELELIDRAVCAVQGLEFHPPARDVGLSL